MSISGLRRDRDADPALRQRAPAVPPILARGGQRAVPHIRGGCIHVVHRLRFEFISSPVFDIDICLQ